MSAEAYEDALETEKAARYDAAEALVQEDPNMRHYVDKWLDAYEYLENHPNRLDYEFEGLLFEKGIKDFYSEKLDND